MEAPKLQHSESPVMEILKDGAISQPDSKRLRTIQTREPSVRSALYAEYALELTGKVRPVGELIAGKAEAEHLLASGTLTTVEMEWQVSHTVNLDREEVLARSLKDQLTKAQLFYKERYWDERGLNTEELGNLYDLTDPFTDGGCFDTLRNMSSMLGGSDDHIMQADRLLRILVASELHLFS